MSVYIIFNTQTNKEFNRQAQRLLKKKNNVLKSFRNLGNNAKQREHSNSQFVLFQKERRN